MGVFFSRDECVSPRNLKGHQLVTCAHLVSLANYFTSCPSAHCEPWRLSSRKSKWKISDSHDFSEQAWEGPRKGQEGHLGPRSTPRAAHADPYSAEKAGWLPCELWTLPRQQECLLFFGRTASCNPKAYYVCGTGSPLTFKYFQECTRYESQEKIVS